MYQKRSMRQHSLSNPEGNPCAKLECWDEGMSVRPIVVISRCLGGEICRYDGQHLESSFVKKLQNYAQLIPICPEMEIELGMPRAIVQLVKYSDSLHLIQPSTGTDLTQTMQTFSKQFLESLGDVDGFILKSRSPSCGILDTKQFDSSERTTVIGYGPGIFAQRVMVQCGDLPIEDENRLNDPEIRRNFLTQLFSIARNRVAKAANHPPSFPSSSNIFPGEIMIV